MARSWQGKVWSSTEDYTKGKQLSETDACPQLHNPPTKWHSLSPIKGSHWGLEEKQDLCTGMAQEQARSQSSQELVDYYEG